MKIPIYQVDAFTKTVFSGNPAAVCVIENDLPDDVMQNIAAENNLAETAFLKKTNDEYEIRWFTPVVEVDLCGHATLASGFVLFECLNFPGEEITFHSPRSGRLGVRKSPDGLLTLDFPKDELTEISPPQTVVDAIGKLPVKAFKGKTDYLFIYSSQEDVEAIAPDFKQLAEAGGRGAIVSAPGKDVDFVSRFFAPQSGIDEDPVTGSAHTSMTPYWADVLNKKELTARQLSKRGGWLACRLSSDRVSISGYASLYLTGEITVES